MLGGKQMIKTILKLFYLASCVVVSIYFCNQIIDSYISNFGKGIHIACILVFMFGTVAWIRHLDERKK